MSAEPPPHDAVVRRLGEALNACSQAGDFTACDAAVAAVIGIIESIIDTPPSDLDSTANASEDALREILCFVSDPSSNQGGKTAVDALLFELPKVVAELAEVSDKCREIAGSVMDHIVSVCSPRDMLSILCEALDTRIKVSQAPVSHIILLSGLAKVLLRIQRHHVEQLKVALPVIVGVQNAVSSESDEGDDVLYDFFDVAISIGNSIQEISQKLVERRKELFAILGLYVLQSIALVSRCSRTHNISKYSSLIKKFSHFLPCCGLSYLGLIVGSDIDAVRAELSKEDSEDFMTFFSLTMNGASLPVIWGHISDEVAKAAGEQLTTVLNELRGDHTKRWRALGTLRHVLFSIDYPWEMKSHCVEFILSMMEESVRRNNDDSNTDYSSFMPSLFTTLQAIQRVIMGSSNASSRKKAFGAFRKVLLDLPPSQRLDMLKALIQNCNSPSMIAILIDRVKEEVLLENNHKKLRENGEINDLKDEIPSLAIWNSSVLDFVELVLRPPKGGPPPLPELSEPVLSALNLYRFILITESTGNTNYTGVLSENNLRKAYFEWLLPLRTLISGIEAENEKDSDFTNSIQCALNPVQLVLYRCIELVEDNLKHPQ